jgi:3-oxoacyl-[acyl-carrier-protein] synthase II
MRTVCVTGYGFISPLGHELADFDQALFEGRSAIQAQSLALPGNDPVQVPVAQADFIEANARPPSRLPIDRGTAMALLAGEAAAREAALVSERIDPYRLGIYWGSGMGGAATFDATCRAVYADHKRIRPTSVVTAMPNAPVAELALRFGARGAALGFACACASSSVAVGEALRALRAGWLDVAIVGGSEALLSPGVLGAWQAMRVLAPVANQSADQIRRACRPFAADRSGFALGEGAAALVLETTQHARARGAGWEAVISGYGTNCDAKHITQPDPEGQRRAMQAALDDAGLDAAEIGHVNAHGTATTAGDAAEAESLCRLFGPAQPPVTATKSIMGHLLGAGGALELVASLRALAHRAAPPTGGVDAIDPGFEIDLVRGNARPLPNLRHVMSNSFAFGGTNAVLIATRVD